jgi:hypothetical protein
MNVIHQTIDAKLYDILKQRAAHHIGVFEGPPGVLSTLEAVWHAWRQNPRDGHVELAFKTYPPLKMIFDMLMRPGERAFVLSERSGATLSIVRTSIVAGEQVWFRWMDGDLSDAVAAQCLRRNVYGHAVTVWAYS